MNFDSAIPVNLNLPAPPTRPDEDTAKADIQRFVTDLVDMMREKGHALCFTMAAIAPYSDPDQAKQMVASAVLLNGSLPIMEVLTVLSHNAVQEVIQIKKTEQEAGNGNTGH